MIRLFLLRHSKAGWAEPGMRDFDRPLEVSGVTDAQAAGLVMHARGHIPDLALCSGAKRARETLDGVCRSFSIASTIFTDALYSTDAAGYVEVINSAPDVASILLVGHNPMMEDVAMALSGDGHESARNAMISGFPTSAIAIIRFSGTFAAIAPGQGFLEDFVTSADF